MELENPLFRADGDSDEISEGASKLGTVRMVEGILLLLLFLPLGEKPELA